MPEPTGNRWRDPDTGEIANKRNVQLDTFKGSDAASIKHGPALTDPAMQGPDREPPTEDPLARAERIKAEALERAGAAAAVTNPVAAAADPAAPHTDPAPVEVDPDLPEVRPVLGTALREPQPQAPVTPPNVPTITEDYEVVVAKITEFGPRARAGDSEAASKMNQIAQDEYERESPRVPIVKRLSSYGFGRPARG